MKGIPRREHYDLLIRNLPAPVHRLLGAAAERRNMKPDQLVVEILTGVIYRGSIDRCVNGWRSKDALSYRD
jgi:hypothetical protein